MNILRKLKLSKILDVEFTDYEKLVIYTMDNILKDIDIEQDISINTSIYYVNIDAIVIQYVPHNNMSCINGKLLDIFKNENCSYDYDLAIHIDNSIKEYIFYRIKKIIPNTEKICSGGLTEAEKQLHKKYRDKLEKKKNIT